MDGSQRKKRQDDSNEKAFYDRVWNRGDAQSDQGQNHSNSGVTEHAQRSGFSVREYNRRLLSRYRHGLSVDPVSPIEPGENRAKSDDDKSKSNPWKPAAGDKSYPAKPRDDDCQLDED